MDWSKNSSHSASLAVNDAKIMIFMEKDMFNYTYIMYINVDLNLPTGALNDVSSNTGNDRISSICFQDSILFPTNVYEYPSLYNACKWTVATALDHSIPAFLKNGFVNEIADITKKSLDVKSWSKRKNGVSFSSSKKSIEYTLLVSEARENNVSGFAEIEIALPQNWFVLDNSAQILRWTYEKMYAPARGDTVMSVAGDFATTALQLSQDGVANLERSLYRLKEDLTGITNQPPPIWA